MQRNYMDYDKKKREAASMKYMNGQRIEPLPPVLPIGRELQYITDRQSCLFGHWVMVNKYPCVRRMETAEDMAEIIGIGEPVMRMDPIMHGGVQESDLAADDIW